jgi:CRISPR/Cas system-associated exonuclease Cas4 (RecB family)
MGDLGSGKVRATYENNKIEQKKFSDEYLLTPPKCKYCDYAGLCEVSNG